MADSSASHPEVAAITRGVPQDGQYLNAVETGVPQFRQRGKPWPHSVQKRASPGLLCWQREQSMELQIGQALVGQRNPRGEDHRVCC